MTTTNEAPSVVDQAKRGAITLTAVWTALAVAFWVGFAFTDDSYVGLFAIIWTLAAAGTFVAGNTPHRSQR